ncbi:MAG: DUF4139 domain-containing protein [Dysgonomonas sp.]|nr:DUF4139 domain-containing protein [Dysgonomonas sp.]
MKIKHFAPLAILLAGITLNGTAQDKKTVKSNLKSVTVFLQGAELMHSASSSLTKGENEIYIEGLSPNIDKNSLKVKTTNGVIVSASEFSVDFLAKGKEVDTKTKRMEDSIRIYRKKLELLQTEMRTTDNLLDMLQKGTDKNVSGSEKGLGMDELIKTMDYYQEKSGELQKKRLAYIEEKNEYTTTISRLQKQFEQESMKNNKSVGVLKLTLSSPAITNCDFTVSYFTMSAGWTPFYDINIESIDKPIKILGKSKVRQTTGLDWQKVKLTLSSSIPSNGKVAPLFRAWFLDFYRPKSQVTLSRGLQGKLSGFTGGIAAQNMAAQNAYSYSNLELSEAKEESEKKDMLYIVDGIPVDADYAQSLDQDKIKDMQVLKDASATSLYGSQASNGVVVITLKSNMEDYIVQTENDMNTVYEIDMPYTIPGNGKEQTIDLLTTETNAEYKYYCAPKLDVETYLLAEISNWERLKLLNGTASITYDGTYVGETYIDTRSTHKKLTLTLGTDKRVSVKRERLQDYSSTKFLGSDVKQIFTYKLTVRNSQNKPVQMTLKDQYPRSTQKSIDVELITKETTPWSYNIEDLGVITWEEEFKAGETKIYYISYSVKYPKNSTLNF